MDRCGNWIVVRAQPASLLCRRRRGAAFRPRRRQIQILERVLGVQLLARTSRIVRLTSAGRTFLPEARRILHLADSAAVSTRRTAAGDLGSVAIGFTATGSYSFLPELITTARERLPGID